MLGSEQEHSILVIYALPCHTGNYREIPFSREQSTGRRRTAWPQKM